MAIESLIRAAAPMLLATVTALAVDRLTLRRGLQPPGFRPDVVGPGPAALRRAVALAILAAVLWIGVFAPLGMIGTRLEPDFSQIQAAQLFLLHALFAGALAVWYLLGFVGSGGSWGAQLGLRPRRLLPEIGIGLLTGLAGWMAVLAALVALGSLVWALGGQELLPQQPPAMMPWLAGLPIWLRLAVSLSAGAVEEAFFRGFLQPRVGIPLSTALFVLAHAGYEQPLMLIGITLLSLLFAFLVRWRQNIWPAVAAHALFDAVQLLVVVPTALKFMPAGGPVAQALPIVW